MQDFLKLLAQIQNIRIEKELNLFINLISDKRDLNSENLSEFEKVMDTIISLPEQYSGILSKNIICKISNDNWVYLFATKTSEYLKGYSYNNGFKYTLDVKIDDVLEKYYKVIPPLNKNEYELFLKYAIRKGGFSVKKLKLSLAQRRKLKQFYKEEIQSLFEKTFINCVIEGNYQKIYDELNLTPLEIKNYKEKYSSKILKAKKGIINLPEKNQDKEFINLPEEEKNEKNCKSAIQRNGLLIKYVPEHLITKSLCYSAIRQNWEAIKYIEEKYRTKDLLNFAVKQNYKTISYLSLKDENELCNYLKINDEIFRHLPLNQRSKKICEMAFYNNIENIAYIPDKYLTKEICTYFLNNIRQTITSISFKNKWIKKVEKRLQLLSLNINNTSKKENNVFENIIAKPDIEQKEDAIEKIINKKKYNDISDLISIEKSEDKIFNLYLIKKHFEELNPDFQNKLSKINKNSTKLKIKSDYSGIFYYWQFMKGSLEISLEFSSKDKLLTSYFDKKEKELKSEVDDTLVVGRTSTQTIIYIQKAKYTLDWAIKSMIAFKKVLDSKLKIFYQDKFEETEEVFETDITLDKENNSIEVNYLDSFDVLEDENNFNEQININIKDGRSVAIQLTRYERNPKNRALALKAHGTTCLACGFNFNNFYGKDLANNFIEVHHIKPVSKGEYIVNPLTDLVPLCSNCHSMIHHEKNPPQTIEEIRNRYKK